MNKAQNGLAKQAKVLSAKQQDLMLNYLQGTRYPLRNRVMFLLSFKAGLRAKEIAELEWSMVSDAEGNLSDEIHLQDKASKGRSGRVIPLHPELRGALAQLRERELAKPRQSPFVITTERAQRTSANAVAVTFLSWYRDCNLEASSHSGRRTAITNWARKISTVGGSLKDVQALAGHTTLTMTQKYIEPCSDAQKKLVGIC